MVTILEKAASKKKKLLIDILRATISNLKLKLVIASVLKVFNLHLRLLIIVSVLKATYLLFFLIEKKILLSTLNKGATSIIVLSIVLLLAFSIKALVLLLIFLNYFSKKLLFIKKRF